MKTKEIVIGSEYLTKIGESLARVIVVAERPDSFSGRMRFLVRRVGEDRVLPKSRSASALRPLPAKNAPVSLVIDENPNPLHAFDPTCQHCLTWRDVLHG